MRKFLPAEWKDLILVNYEIDPKLLASRIPAGTAIDLNNGKCFVSLVGFMFLGTRVLGAPIPFHINFEEVNLRFYVRRKNGDEVRRGVCFIKEMVPRRAIATVARSLYGEPYECWNMEHQREPTVVGYKWVNGGRENEIRVSVGKNIGVPAARSHGEFIIEHYWGYTSRGNGRVDEYRVEHPKWELFTTENPRIDVDFRLTYGREFAFLSKQEPFSVMLAAGSKIAVFKGKSIHD